MGSQTPEVRHPPNSFGKSDTHQIRSGKSDAGKPETDTGSQTPAKFVREFATDAGGCHAGSRRWRRDDPRASGRCGDMNSSAVLLGFSFEREHRPDWRRAFGALRDVRPITVPRNRSVGLRASGSLAERQCGRALALQPGFAPAHRIHRFRMVDSEFTHGWWLSKFIKVPVT
jgi:hypothetical protein